MYGRLQKSIQQHSRTYEGQDAEAEVVCHRGDNSAHPQHGERGVTARDDQVTGQIPEHVPAQQVTLKTRHRDSLYSLHSDIQTYYAEFVGAPRFCEVQGTTATRF